MQLPPQISTPTSQSYLSLMIEIKARLASIWRIRDEKVAQPFFQQPVFASEYALHQLRMVCECIAFACLVAHDDVPATREPTFKNEWSATKIMNKLEKIRPDFFPKALRREGGISFVDLPNPMTKEEIGKLYHYCNEKMHRGFARDILDSKMRAYDEPFIARQAERVGLLVQNHRILLKGDHDSILVMMGSADEQPTWIRLGPPLHTPPRQA